MPNNKKLSISIVNFQSKDFIEKCLASVFEKNKNIDLEVIIVNNDENEDLKEIQKKFPEIRIIDHKKNIGFGAGHNLGAKEAQGGILLFLNPDAEIIDSITPILGLFDDEEVGIAGPCLITEKGKIQKWSVGLESSLGGILRNNLGIPKSRKLWESNKTRKVDWVSGAAFFIKRDLFKELGGFDENFFMYYEDEDLCKRARTAGKKVVYFPAVKVKHWGGKSMPERKTQKKYFYKAQEYYFKKHLGNFRTRMLKILREIILGT